jgi:hypothetical protein
MGFFDSKMGVDPEEPEVAEIDAHQEAAEPVLDGVGRHVPTKPCRDQFGRDAGANCTQQHKREGKNNECDPESPTAVTD